MLQVRKIDTDKPSAPSELQVETSGKRVVQQRTIESSIIVMIFAQNGV